MLEILVRLCLNKGDGVWPDLSLLDEAERTTEVLHRHTKLLLNPPPETYPVVGEPVVVHDGLTPSERGPGVQVVDGAIVGYPTPLIVFKLDVINTDMDAFDPEDFMSAVGLSSYRTELPGCDEPWYWEDHNGYSTLEMPFA